MSIADIIGHYQRSIEKSTNDESRLLHCIEKLYKLPVTVHHLQETGIGKTVNSLRKYDGEVGVAAKSLVAKWKAMVAAETIVEEDLKKKSPDDDPSRKYNNRNSMKHDDKKNYSKPNENNSKDLKSKRGESCVKEINVENRTARISNDKYSSSSYKNDTSSNEVSSSLNHSTSFLENENRSDTEGRRKKGSGKNGLHKSSSSKISVNNIDKSSCDDEPDNNSFSYVNSKLDEEIANLMMESSQLSRENQSKKNKRDREKDHHSNKHSNRSHKDKNNHKNMDEDSVNHKSHRKHSENHVHQEEKHKILKRKDSENSHQVEEPAKKKTKKIIYDGIDSSMGTSFEEALGMVSSTVSVKNVLKTKSPKGNEAISSTSSSSHIFAVPSSRKVTRSNTPPLLASKIKLEPLDPTIALELPTISPHYKPMPLNPTVMDCVFSNNNKPQRPLMTDEEALCAGISSKTMRTKIYSGIKSGVMLQVPSLFDLCIRVLQKNFHALSYIGGIPFYIVQTVVERATPQQLLTFEAYNPQLMVDTDDLWKQHCARHYKTQKRLELESWREMFLRCKEEQDERLSVLAEKVKTQNQQKIPIRRTQLAYIDSTVKPPRNIQRKQEQYGTKGKMIATPAARVATLSNMAPTITKLGDSRLRIGPDVRDTAQATSSLMRPKKAPLMQKTLQLMKGRFKR